MNNNHILFILFNKEVKEIIDLNVHINIVCFANKCSLESVVFLQLEWQRLKKKIPENNLVLFILKCLLLIFQDSIVFSSIK